MAYTEQAAGNSYTTHVLDRATGELLLTLPGGLVTEFTDGGGELFVSTVERWHFETNGVMDGYLFPTAC